MLETPRDKMLETPTKKEIEEYIQERINKYNMDKISCRQWKNWECWIMNIIDFRFWFCECHYKSPYGKVIFAGCKKHD